jgi:hypothetical protein
MTNAAPEASADKPHKKHWLDWAGWAVGVAGLLFSGVTLYRTQLIQKDDIRVVVDGTLEVRPDKGDLLLDQDQQLTFINSGNRAAVITEIYGELVLVTATDTGCDGPLAKSIVFNPTQIVVKPGEILPVRAKVAERYPWVKDGSQLRFRRQKDEQSDSYIVCLQLYVTTPDSTSIRWVRKLSLVPTKDGQSSDEREKGHSPLSVIKQSSWGLD